MCGLTSVCEHRVYDIVVGVGVWSNISVRVNNV